MRQTIIAAQGFSEGMATEEQVAFGPYARTGAPAINARAATNRTSQLSAHIAALVEEKIRVRLLEGFSNHERSTILSAALYQQFSRETTVLRQGDPAESLYLLIRGSARFFFLTPDGERVYLHWLAPGEIFGAASLLQFPKSFLVSTEVSARTHVLVWQRNVVRRLAAVYPRLLENALSVASDYLTWYLATHLSLVSYNARQRLAYVLMTLADGIGRRCSGGVRLEVTNEQLANTANITVFTASRFLKELQRAGALSKSRREILVIRPEMLFRQLHDSSPGK